MTTSEALSDAFEDDCFRNTWNKKKWHVIKNQQDSVIMHDIAPMWNSIWGKKETVIIPTHYISWTSTWFCSSHLWPFHEQQFASLLINILRRFLGVADGPSEAGGRWLLIPRSFPVAVTVALVWRHLLATVSWANQTKTTVLWTWDLKQAKVFFFFFSCSSCRNLQLLLSCAACCKSILTLTIKQHLNCLVEAFIFKRVMSYDYDNCRLLPD